MDIIFYTYALELIFSTGFQRHSNISFSTFLVHYLFILGKIRVVVSWSHFVIKFEILDRVSQIYPVTFWAFWTLLHFKMQSFYLERPLQPTTSITAVLRDLSSECVPICQLFWFHRTMTWDQNTCSSLDFCSIYVMIKLVIL